ncbi:hypothetical protein NLX86_26480 [Streptomyces sp. A3M-1-3]|uniref:hypothetical protein n=1 Tax=Streptomyces sp. A3M-1-3 TaxID=2962044 RepID=UPI0020B8F5A3|nr:hypothetical protein [Streptomyces sp. A3M-1-3]MCP3821510.1 hypothetical protein [Streptomyces sp. A3M-1-3]
MTTPSGPPRNRHERLLAMRAERRLLHDADVEAAIDAVDNNGLIPLLQDFVHLGRGRKLRLRALLTGIELRAARADRNPDPRGRATSVRTINQVGTRRTAKREQEPGNE